MEWRRYVFLLKDRRFAGVACALLGFLLGALVFGEPWHLPPDWGDIPTWLLFVAGVVGGWAALSQLQQQADVIKDEVERNVERDKLLDGQLRELEQREQSRRREQAEGVELTWTDDGSLAGQSFVRLTNHSRRPIRNLEGVVYRELLDERPISAVHAGELRTDGVGMEQWVPPASPPLCPLTSVEVLRSGLSAGFEFDVLRADCPAGDAVVEFIDDAGYRWALHADMSLGPAKLDR